MDGRKYFYYNHFLGEVVRIAEWKYDEAKKIVHYRIWGTKDWEADTMPLSEPKFCDSESDCEEQAQSALEKENLNYRLRQQSAITSFISAVDESYANMDIISWRKVRGYLGKDKCNVLREILKWHDEDGVINND